MEFTGNPTNKKINIYAIFKDIMRCFSVACSITLLLIFFYYKEIEPTIDNIYEMVKTIFWFLVYLVVLCNLLIRKRWFYDDEILIKAKEPIGRATLIDDDTVYKLSKETKNYNKKVTSVHEAGHALMAYLKGMESFTVNTSCLNPRVVTVDKLADAEAVKNLILIKYSGAVAEELLLGKTHLGCMYGNGNDFSEATGLIKAYVVMSTPDVSKTLLNEELSNSIIEYSKEFYQSTCNILTENLEKLKKLADELMRKDTLTKKEIEKLFCSDLK